MPKKHQIWLYAPCPTPKHPPKLTLLPPNPEPSRDLLWAPLEAHHDPLPPRPRVALVGAAWPPPPLASPPSSEGQKVALGALVSGHGWGRVCICAK